MAARRSLPRRRTARWVSGVIVGVLAIAVAVLSVLAIERAQGEPVTGTAQPVPTFTSTPTATPTPTPTPTPTIEAPGSAERFLAVGTSTIWRATAGSCGVAAPVLERSDDGGTTWTDVTPTYLGVGQILALDAFAGTEAEIVARVGANCETQALRTFTQGEFWASYPEVLAASTYVDPANAGSVVVAGSAVAAPCATPWGVRELDGTVGVVCDGTAYQLDGTAWTPVATDAVAVAIRDGAVIAAHAQDGCSGLVVGNACTGVQPPYSPAAIAVDGTSVSQWIGDAVSAVPAA